MSSSAMAAQSDQTVGRVGVVAELWCYPVKSLQGARVRAVEIGPGGVRGDRQWAVVEAADGAVLSAKQEPALLLAAAYPTPDGLAFDVPGAPAGLGGSGAERALSRLLGREVRVVEAASPQDLGFVDDAPLHLVSNRVLAEAAGAGRPPLDRRRFRPNIVLALDPGAPAESDWAGRKLRIGAVECAVTEVTLRCTMPGAAQPGLPRDRELPRRLAQDRRNMLGVYADVLGAAGTVEPGAEVALR